MKMLKFYIKFLIINTLFCLNSVLYAIENNKLDSKFGNPVYLNAIEVSLISNDYSIKSDKFTDINKKLEFINKIANLANLKFTQKKSDNLPTLSFFKAPHISKNKIKKVLWDSKPLDFITLLFYMSNNTDKDLNDPFVVKNSEIYKKQKAHIVNSRIPLVAQSDSKEIIERINNCLEIIKIQDKQSQQNTLITSSQKNNFTNAEIIWLFITISLLAIVSFLFHQCRKSEQKLINLKKDLQVIKIEVGVRRNTEKNLRAIEQKHNYIINKLNKATLVNTLLNILQK